MRHVGPSPVDVCTGHAEVTMHIAAQQWQALADAFFVNKTINEVDLSKNMIGNKGVEAQTSQQGHGCR